MCALYSQVLFCNAELGQNGEPVEGPNIDSLFFDASPSHVLYNIEVILVTLNLFLNFT